MCHFSPNHRFFTRVKQSKRSEFAQTFRWIFLIFITTTWMTSAFLAEFIGTRYWSVNTAQAAPYNIGASHPTPGMELKMHLFCREVNLMSSCMKILLGSPNKSLAQIQSLWPSPTAKVHIIIFYMKEALTTGFTPKSIKLSPASERSVNQIHSMCALIIPRRVWL